MVTTAAADVMDVRFDSETKMRTEEEQKEGGTGASHPPALPIPPTFQTPLPRRPPISHHTTLTDYEEGGMAWHGMSRGEHGVCLLCCGRGSISPRGEAYLPLCSLSSSYSGRTRTRRMDGRMRGRTRTPFCWTGTFHNTTARRVQSARAGTGGIVVIPWVVPPSYPLPLPLPILRVAVSEGSRT